MSRYKSRLVPRRKVADLCSRIRKRGENIVFTNGVFDIIHMGHISYLSKAKAMGDVLIIGLNTDKSARKIKGKNRPINKQSDRAGVLSALEFVDYIVYFSEETPEKLIRQIKPDVLVKGADYKVSQIVGADFVKSYGGKVKRIKLLPNRSTSRLAEKLK